MNTEQRRYLLVFTGLFLMILGGLLYMNSDGKKLSKSKKRAEIIRYIEENREDKPENIFVPYDRPSKLNFVVISEL